NGSCNSTFTQNVTLAVNAAPTVTFISQPGGTACANTDVTYTTQSGSGESNYIWSVPSSYTITSGGIGTTDATVTLKYTTSGSKTVTVNYTMNGCTATTASSSTATTVNAVPSAPSAISGNTSACQGENSVAYNVTNTGGTYNWSYSGTGATISGSTAAITIN